MHDLATLAGVALWAGSLFFLLKHSPGDKLIRAVHDAYHRRVYLTPRIAKDVLAALAEPASAAPVELTPRQREVLHLVAEGRTMKEIAATLHLSRRTVESHKYEMKHALGVDTADRQSGV